MPTDEMVQAAMDAFNNVYDGPGSETTAHRAALDTVLPLIRAEALREAAGVVEKAARVHREIARQFDDQSSRVPLSQNGKAIELEKLAADIRALKEKAP